MNISNVDSKITSVTSKELITGYSEWVNGYVGRLGWSPFLMTFMFKPLKATQEEAIRHQMSDEIDRVYSTFVTRVVRKPNAVFQRYLCQRPILIAVPDRPVPKHKRQRLKDVTINNGHHMHGIISRSSEDSTSKIVCFNLMSAQLDQIYPAS